MNPFHIRTSNLHIVTSGKPGGPRFSLASTEEKGRFMISSSLLMPLAVVWQPLVFHAGFAGAAAGTLAFAAQMKGITLGHLEPYVNEEAMISAVKAALGGSGKSIKALVIGALGRCGRGAVDLFRKIGLNEYVLTNIT